MDSGITTENKMYQGNCFFVCFCLFCFEYVTPRISKCVNHFTCIEIQLPTCKAPTEVIESFLAYHEAYHYAIDRLEPDECKKAHI